jgi:hypothetical protein
MTRYDLGILISLSRVMASSSRPFQSRTVSQLLIGGRRWGRSLAEWMRRSRIGMIWGVQVAVYPAYVVVQGIRKGYRSWQILRPWDRAKGLITGYSPSLDRISGDVPIRALLSQVQPQSIGQNHYGRVNRYGPFFALSGSGAVLTTCRWHRLPLESPVVGVASDILSRQVVLVLEDNQVFHGLTIEQQSQLQRAILLLSAEYGRLRRRQAAAGHLRRPDLPLPAVSANQWRFVQYAYRCLGWMQTSPLAVTTNLFGEALLAQRLALHRHQLAEVERHASDNSAAVIEKPIKPGQPPLSRRMSRRQSMANAIADNAKHNSASPANPAVTSMVSQPQSDLRQGAIVNVRVAPPQVPEESDVVEAQATLVDYVDHPLVAILRWVDKGIVWLEIWLKKLWTWLKMHW